MNAIHMRLYARRGTPEAWIVDVNAQRVECWRDPAGTDCRTKWVRQRDDELDVHQLPGVSVAVCEIFRND